MAVKKSALYAALWEACNKMRGGVEPSRYKDYVLLLLFFKYVSDRAKSGNSGDYQVSPGASFDDLVRLKNKENIGEAVDKVIQKFLEENALTKKVPDVSFNNANELGSGKELVDKVTGLIAVFENPALDFRNNRAGGDDIIGDAYEYFMKKFAQDSGKSKGQFYTPGEVSRTIARLIEIGDLTEEQYKNRNYEKWTLYDPACGSGSLLIRAADEAPTDKEGDFLISIYGQEKDQNTAWLAQMNLGIHHRGTAEILQGNTLAKPGHTTGLKELKTFDFIVMNPPFSDKSWSDGLTPREDPYRRFDGYDIPPEKNGDYAWFLHVLKSLNSTGKAGIVMPHGILFRGNAEENIRKQVLAKKYIKAIVSLPANLFFGTGIPACIVILDKENADEREGIFLIDASRGFKKDGNKNRLREQDIERIVQAYRGRKEIPGYSRMVSYKEILEDNGGNLNIPRYIQKIDDTLPQNIDAHLHGGIPQGDVLSLQKLWDISPTLQHTLLKADEKRPVYALAIPAAGVETVMGEDQKIQEEKEIETHTLFVPWKERVKEPLLHITEDTAPKALIRQISLDLLHTYEKAKVLDPYDVYDGLMNYWNEQMQDDVYLIKAEGYEVGRTIEYVYGTKKKKDKNGKTMKDDQGKDISLEDRSKILSFDGILLPKEILETTYFPKEMDHLGILEEEIAALEGELADMREEEGGEGGLLQEVMNDEGNDITKGSLTARIKALEDRRTSPDAEILDRLCSLLSQGQTLEMEQLSQLLPAPIAASIRNKNGTFGKAKLKAAAKETRATAPIPMAYADEYQMLLTYQAKIKEKEEVEGLWKEERKALDEALIAKYEALTVEEIKDLLFHKKWMAALEMVIDDTYDQVLNGLSERLLLMAKRYEHTLGELEEKAETSEMAAKSALERMGYRW